LRFSHAEILETLAHNEGLTDASRAGSFPEAEARLDAVHLNVIVGPDQIGTPGRPGRGADRGRDRL